MGWRYEVFAWVKNEQGRYHWNEIYGGQSLIRAVWRAHKAKKTHHSAIKLEWR